VFSASLLSSTTLWAIPWPDFSKDWIRESTVLIVSPTFTGAGLGAEAFDSDGAGDENLAGVDHHVRFVNFLRALNVAHRRH
jgi:hypothetical protein